jgi:hypothetical protein
LVNVLLLLIFVDNGGEINGYDGGGGCGGDSGVVNINILLRI